MRRWDQRWAVWLETWREIITFGNRRKTRIGHNKQFEIAVFRQLTHKEWIPNLCQLKERLALLWCGKYKKRQQFASCVSTNIHIGSKRLEWYEMIVINNSWQIVSEVWRQRQAKEIREVLCWQQALKLVSERMVFGFRNKLTLWIVVFDLKDTERYVFKNVSVETISSMRRVRSIWNKQG